MALPPEAALEALIMKREKAALRGILSFLTSLALDKISDHAFVVQRWHMFSVKMQTFLLSLEGEEAKKLLGEFYDLVADMEGGSQSLPPLNPRPVIIRHVKWRDLEGYVAPMARTTQFSKLLAANRGTLIFVPEDEDYEEELDEFSKG